MNEDKQTHAPSRNTIIVLVILVVLILVGNRYGSTLTSSTLDTEQRLDAAKEAVLKFAAREGRFPPDWQALLDSGELTVIPTNRAGHALVYTHMDEDRVEIKSLGPDGREGGLWFKADQAIEFGLPAK